LLALVACDLGYQIDVPAGWTEAGAGVDARGVDAVSGASPQPGHAGHAGDAARPSDAQRPDAPPPCPAQEVVVAIRALAFDPMHLAVPPRTRVRWVNQDTMLHDVTEGDPDMPDPLFASGNLRAGDQWVYDFCEPASVVYHCAAHPNTMRDATITVAEP
jgi:plastocyanin